MGTIPAGDRRLAADWAAWAAHHALAAATGVLAQLLDWYLRRQQRHDLAQLDDRALKDVGLSRADVARELDKPFWH